MVHRLGETAVFPQVLSVQSLASVFACGETQKGIAADDG